MENLTAAVAELVDALDSKSSDGNIMRVRFSPAAQINPDIIGIFL